MYFIDFSFVAHLWQHTASGYGRSLCRRSLLRKDLIPSQALCFQDSLPFLLSRLDEILGTQEPSKDSELNLVVQREPSFLRPLKHGLSVTLDFEDAIASFN
jgi:hypothetical protein